MEKALLFFKSTYGRLLFGAIALAYLALAIASGSEALQEGLAQIGFSGIFLLLCLSFASYLLRFWRWHYLLPYHIPLKKHFFIYFAGFSLTMTPGKAGEAVRAVYLKDLGVPYPASFTAFVADRFYDLAAIAFFVLSGSFFFPKAGNILLIAVPLLALLFFLFRSKFGSFSFFALILSLLAWFLEGLALYLLLQMLGERVALFQSVFALSLALLIGALTFLPGGVGGTEAALLEVLTFFGCSFSRAALATLLIRLTTLWFAILLGFAALPFIENSDKKFIQS